jgi:hypothetical protein
MPDVILERVKRLPVEYNAVEVKWLQEKVNSQTNGRFGFFSFLMNLKKHAFLTQFNFL